MQLELNFQSHTPQDYRCNRIRSLPPTQSKYPTRDRKEPRRLAYLYRSNRTLRRKENRAERTRERGAHDSLSEGRLNKNTRDTRIRHNSLLKQVLREEIAKNV